MRARRWLGGATFALLLGGSTALAVAAGPAVPAESVAVPSPTTVAGSAVNRADLAALAAKAEHDPASLARLRAVRSVDGTPVDLRAALAGATPDELRNRLRELAGAGPAASGADGRRTTSAPPTTVGPGAGPSAAAARRAAQAVLARHEFRPAHEPQPLRGALRWLGDRAHPVLAPIGRWFGRLGGRLFGSPLASTVTCIVLALAAALLAVWFARRRGRAAVRSGRATSLRPGGLPDPAALEARADQAERDGDLEEALRLRFLAGLTRLHLLGVIDAPVEEPNGQLAGTLESERFDHLARTFDQVVYGRRTPGADDVDEARAQWPKVLEEQRR